MYTTDQGDIGMSDLVSTVIEAHGGLNRYNQFRSATVHFRGGVRCGDSRGRKGY